MIICKLFLLSAIFLYMVTSAFSAEKLTIQDFVIYTALGERHIFSEVISELPDNTLLIINFTSINCKPCRKEIPELREFHTQHPKQAKLIYIYAEAGKPVQENAKSLGVLNIAYVDPFGKAREIFFVKSVPTTILINKNKNIVARFDGYTEKNMNDIKAILLEKKK
ncbi:MAG: thioredoxin-like domain-containing protein [Spirochaetota bacterium]